MMEKRGVFKVKENPFEQFKIWFEDACQEKRIDKPDAFCLSTMAESGFPRSRILLLRKVENERFYFFTNYESEKMKDITFSTKVALNFFWDPLGYQVRILGEAKKASAVISDAYHQSRSREKQLSAWASPQSQEIRSRDELVSNVDSFRKRFESEEVIPRPSFWGGVEVTPSYYEFWQDGQDRLHDRFAYNLSENPEKGWGLSRLAP